MAALPLTGHAIHKAEMEYHGKIGHTLVRIQHIALMSRIRVSYTTFRLSTQTVSPTLPGLQGINLCVQYIASHPHKTIFILLIIIMAQISSDLHGVRINLKTIQPIIVYNAIKMRIMHIISPSVESYSISG